MKKSIKLVFVSCLVLLSSLFFLQQPAYAAGSSSVDCNRGFLGFPAWYRGLTIGSKSGDAADNKGCDLKTPDAVGGIGNYIWKIILNIIEIISMAIGYITIGMILLGGFQYLTSAGSSDAIKKAKSTITNAIIGLVLSIAATAIINLIVNLWR